MRTLDRNSKALDAAAIDRLHLGLVEVIWSVRIADAGGDWTSSSGWTYYELPADSVLNRSRNLSIDGGPGQMSISLLASEIPLGTTPKVGYRIEVDRYINGQPWPYFTGKIDAVDTGWSLQDGAAVQTYEVACSGVLKRCEGRWIDTIAIAPQQGTSSPYKLTGIVKEVRGSFLAAGPGNTQAIPGAVNTLNFSTNIDDPTIAYTILSPNANLSSPYNSSGASDFTASTSAWPGTITWQSDGGEPTAGATVYYRFYQVYGFGIRRYQGTTPPDFFVCPFGRDPRDIFQTEVSSYNAGSTTITPKDPLPYDSDAGLLDPGDGSPLTPRGAQVELLAITDSDGTESVVAIASTNASGQIVLDSAPSFTPVAGDLIRVVTTELYPAWEEFGQRLSGTDRIQTRFWGYKDDVTEGATFGSGDTTLTVLNGTNFFNEQYILIDSEILKITAITGNDLTVSRGELGTTAASHDDGADVYAEVRRNLVTARPDIGLAVPNGFHYTTLPIYATASPIKGPSDASSDPNRVEEVIKDVFGNSVSGSLGLFADNDILTFLHADADWGPTGAYMKNHVRYQMDAMDFLAEIKETALPANCYIVDTPDGKIAIRPFVMADAPDLVVNTVSAIQQKSEPDPLTAIIVIAEDEKPINVGKSWAYESNTTFGSGMTNPHRAIDGNPSADLTTTQTTITTPGYFKFAIPAATPLQAYPEISEIKIYGKYGFATLYLTQDGSDVFVPGASWLDLNKSGGAVTIPGEAIARALGNLDPEAETILTIMLEADNSGLSVFTPGSTAGWTAAQISEIEIYAKKVNAWRAELSDDSAKLPTAYQPTSPTTQFGSIFVQADPGDSTGAGTEGKRVSYLWAPTAYLKRVAADYENTAANMKHRLKVIRLTGVSQYDARQLAEDYLLEETYKATPYVITCQFDDRIEIGDTIGVPWPDGTVKILLVEALSDSGGFLDGLVQLTCTDRSSSNRQAA